MEWDTELLVRIVLAGILGFGFVAPTVLILGAFFGMPRQFVLLASALVGLVTFVYFIFRMERVRD